VGAAEKITVLEIELRPLGIHAIPNMIAGQLNKLNRME
jgi:hypothetical protein